ncbi:minor capsid protein [candidate division WOR-3 bacterium]|nr:minor capsid protein [candidate division WOR-3 bacterium]
MNQTDFNTYWEKRTALRTTAYFSNVDNVSKAIHKVYISNYNQLQKEVALIYKKYLKTGKGAYKAAYVKQIMTNIDPNLTKLFLKQNKEMEVLFGNTYQNEFYNAIFDLGRGGLQYSFTPLNSKALAKVLAYPWSGADFSERIWDNRAKLVRSLKQNITQGLVQGQGFPEMTRNLAKRMDVSYKQANVLVRTETQYFVNQAHYDSYVEAGIDKYQFSAAMEKQTCPECASLDGRIFLLKNAVVGVNYPTIHPDCRCDTIPELGQSRTGTKSAKIGDEWVEVPKTMTFDEWIAKNEFAYLNPLGI